MIEQKCGIVFIVFYEEFSLLLDGLEDVDGCGCYECGAIAGCALLCAGTTWRLSTGSTDPNS